VPLTPDRRPGILDEDEGINLEPQSVAPTVNGEFRYVAGIGFRFYEEGVEKGLTGTGLTEPQHKVLLNLIHFIDEGPAEGFASGATKTISGGTNAFPTTVTWRRADATKLVEQVVTWTGSKPTAVQWEIYAADGSTVLATVTDAITYSGVFETGRTRTIV